MKKTLFPCLALLLAACGGLNKNTVSYQMSKYDSAQYYVVAGEGGTKKEAAATAMANMRKELLEHTPEQGQSIIDDLLANAKVEKVWRDKSAQQKHFLGLAVLPREKANTILIPLLNQADAQLAGLWQQFSSPADPLADLKVAYQMQPVVQQRMALDDTYQFMQAGRSRYRPDVFAPYKTIFKEKLAAVLVGVEITGTQSRELLTYVVDALNKMGLGVVQAEDPDQVILVTVETDIDNYSSKKVDGLIWCSAGASVSLIDVARGATFARFNVYDRAGTSRLADCVRRSMEAVGEKAAQKTAAGLEEYLKMK